MPLFAPGPRDARIQELCRLLEIAKAAVRETGRERLMDGFDSRADFADFLKDAHDRVAAGRLSWLGRRKLLLAFAPASDWDDCVGGVALGNSIYELLSSVYGSWR